MLLGSFVKLRGLILLLFILIILSGESSGRIACLRGFVTDANGAPVVDADLDFDDAQTGERIFTPGDNTDENGFYTVCVLSGVYHISFAPPPETHILGKQFFNVSMFSDTALDVTLDFGVVLSGFISDPLGIPIGGVDIDADSVTTGGRAYTPNDDTDPISGAYWIVLPPENYRLRFQPPAASRWRGLQIDSLTILADTDMDIVLEEGILLTGSVTDNIGQGIAGISIDLRDYISGEKIYVANNKTDSTGFFNVAAPTGLFQLRFEPPAGNRWVGVAIDSFTIEGDTAIDQILETGLLVNAFVRDSIGSPIPGADLDFIKESTGEKIFTPHDKTDSSGVAIVSILPDIYTIRVDPPAGSAFSRLVTTGVIVQNDTTFDFLLPQTQRVNLSGRVVNLSGSGLQDIEIDLIDISTRAKVHIQDNETDSAGFYNLAVPTGTFDALFSPPAASRYVGIMLRNNAILQDTIWSDIALDTGLVFAARVYDLRGRPVADADFDFISDSSGTEMITPHDNTDSSGLAEITVPSGTYTIQLSPPAGSSLLQQTVSEFNLSTDTTVTFFLADGSSSPPEKFILKNNYPNPFNQATMFTYILLEDSQADIVIYNTLGQHIRTLKPANRLRGFHSVRWDGADRNGNPVASGIYFYQLKTKYGKKTGKMVLLR